MRRLIAILAASLVLFPMLPADSAWIGFYGAVQHYQRGEPIHVYAGAFFPRYLCTKKIKFRLKDSEGDKFRMKSLKTEAEGLLSSRNGETYIGDVPDGAAYGRAKIRGKQKCGQVLGSASDTKTIYILRPDGAPEVTVADAPDVISGETTEMHLRITMPKWTRTWLSVSIEYEVMPDVWKKVDTVLSTALLIDGGDYEIPWKAKLGTGAPAGRYRFHVTFTRTEFEGGIQEEAFAEFLVAEALPAADRPLDGGVDGNGNMLVADTGENAILVYDDSGELVTTYGGADLEDPKDLDFGPDGKIYVADYSNGRIAVLSPSGQFLEDRGAPIPGVDFSGAFCCRGGPDSVAVDADAGVFYVASRGHGVVYVFPLNSDTQDPEAIEIPEFDEPQDVAVAEDGTLYVADESAHKVFHLSQDGTLLGILGADFGGPARSVSIDADGRIYVVAGQPVDDHFEHEIWVFAEDGTFLTRLGRDLLRDTSGVEAAGAAGDVYVMEQNLGHVYRFRSP